MLFIPHFLILALAGVSSTNLDVVFCAEFLRVCDSRSGNRKDRDWCEKSKLTSKENVYCSNSTVLVLLPMSPPGGVTLGGVQLDTVKCFTYLSVG